MVVFLTECETHSSHCFLRALLELLILIISAFKFGLWPFARFRQELSLIIILNVFRCRKLQKRQKFSRKPFSFDAFAKIVLFYHCRRLILLRRICFYVFRNIWIDSWTKLKLKIWALTICTIQTRIITNYNLNVFRCRKLQKRQKFSRKPFSFDAFAKIVLFYHCRRLMLLQRIFSYVFCNIWIDSWTKLKLKRARVCFFS